MEVLKSNNWKKYRPIVVCVETADHIKGTKNGARNGKIEDFLNLKNYRLHVNVGTDSIFIDKFYK